MHTEDLFLLAESSTMELGQCLTNVRSRDAEERMFHLESALIHADTARECVNLLTNREDPTGVYK